MKFVRRHITLSLIAIALVGGSVFIASSLREADPLPTAVVDRGRIESSVTVSGIARASEAAELRFAEQGTITDILVKKGDRVEAGQSLALIESGDLDADRREAMAGLSRALASRDELIEGPQSEARAVSSTSVEVARANLERVRSEESAKVAAAERALNTADLALVPDDPVNEDTPPVVGGSYLCDATGEYRFEVFPSNAKSGYSYRLSGLESGLYSANTDTADLFGECGLTLLFDEDESYRRSTWTLSIPNTRGASYVTLNNALTLAKERERVAIEAASNALTEALRGAENDNASPRSEELRRASATIEEALARIARIDALRERRTLRAPFSGTVTDVLPKRGEVATIGEPVVVLVSDKAFEVIARIPEIDVTKILEGAAASLVFDAMESETLRGTIAFISPLATSIDGVAYFDATIDLATVPSWMREGLNADVRLISLENDSAVRAPRRFLKDNGGTWTAFIQSGDTTVEQSVTPGIIGSDGFVEVDLEPGTVLVTPPVLSN